MDGTAESNDGYGLEGLITLAEACKRVPGRPHASTLWRWCRKGVVSRGGDRVHLRHVRMGSRVFTSNSWIEEFGSALAEADARSFAQPCPSASVSARSREETESASRTPQTSFGQEFMDQAELVRELEREGL